MSTANPDVKEHLSAAEEGTVAGIGYVRIPAHDLDELAEFYKSTFGMQQIGGFLDFAIMLNVGKTVEEAVANPAPRVMLDKRMKSNRDNGPHDNNAWIFMTKGIEHVIRRAEQNGAVVVMEPYPVVSPTAIVAARFRDPAGNQIDLTEIGTDTPEKLYVRSPANQLRLDAASENGLPSRTLSGSGSGIRSMRRDHRGGIETR